MSSPKSAANNVVSPMRRLGLFDEEGALTSRGNKWRIDGTYAEACEEIVDEIYPDELAGLTDDNGQPDRGAVVTWLQHKGLGESNAKQMASTYVLIASRVPPEPSAVNTTPKAEGKSPRQKSNAAATSHDKGTVDDAGTNQHDTSSDAKGALAHTSGDDGVAKHGIGPQIHLDIQIHIPATADAEQIDAIFASMAKHLYP